MSAALMGRGVAAITLLVGVVVGSLVGGTYGAVLGVLLTMVGFQALTRGVEGAPYIVAGVATTAGIVFIAWRHHLTWTSIGLGRSTWITGLLWSLGIVLVVGVVIGLAGSQPRLHHLFADQRITQASGAVTTRRVLLDIPFGTVLIEELAFRGVMLALVTTLTNTFWAVVVTSILFGLWHIAPALEMHEAHDAATGESWWTVVSTVLVTGLSGAGFALLRLYTGSLFPPAALHWAGNGTGVVVGWFVHGRKPKDGFAHDAETWDDPDGVQPSRDDDAE